METAIWKKMRRGILYSKKVDLDVSTHPLRRGGMPGEGILTVKEERGGKDWTGE